mgnify:CR=1 FL=1
MTRMLRGIGASLARLLAVSDAPGRESRLGRYATWQLFALSVTLTSLVLIGSYWGVNVLAYNYVANDRWCDLATEGFGLHCFSDFHQFVLIPPGEMLGESLNTSQGRSPLGSVISDLFSLVGLLSPRGALFGWILISAFLMLFPIIWATRGLGRSQRIQGILLLGVLTLPFWAVLDRGQQMALAVPLMLVYGIALVRNRYMWAAASAAALFLIKPYLILLLLPILGCRKAKPIALWATTVTVGLLISFLPYGLGAFGRAQSWFTQLLGVGEAQGLRFDTSPASEAITGSYPYDYSLVGALTDFAYRISPVIRTDELLGILPRVTFIGAVISLALIVLLVIVKQHLDPVRWVVALLAAANVAATPAYSYQFAFVLVGVALLVGFGPHPPVHSQSSTTCGGFRFDLLPVVLLLSLLPLIVPLQLPVANDPLVANEIPLIDNVYPIFLTILWYVFIITSVIQGFGTRRRAQSQSNASGGLASLAWLVIPTVLLSLSTLLWFQAREPDRSSTNLGGFERLESSFGQAGSGFGRSLALESDLFVTGGAERTMYFPLEPISGSLACLGGQVRFAMDGIQVRLSDASGREQISHDFSAIGSNPHRLVLTPDGRSIFVVSDSVQSVALEEPICVNVAGGELAAAPNESLFAEVQTPTEALDGARRLALFGVAASIGIVGLGLLGRRRSSTDVVP